jgi:hypothetical protein
MSSLTFVDAGEVGSHGLNGGTYLVVATEPTADRTIIFSGILNKDFDGAPNCYAAFPNINGGSDSLHNAKSDENAPFNALDPNPLPDPPPNPNVVHPHNWQWVGVANKTWQEAQDAGLQDRLDYRSELAGRSPQGPHLPPTFPVLRADNPAFYVSTTAWARNTHVPDTDPRHYWDASTFSYGALTPPLRDLGVGQGDFGLAVRRDTGVSEAFFFADAGNGQKVGEMSGHLYGILFPHNENEEGHPVAFLVFPGSSAGHPLQNQQEDPNAIASRTIRQRLSNLSSHDNVSTIAGLMASGFPFGQQQPYEAYEAQVNDAGRVTRRVDVVYGRSQASLDRMATALRPWGYNPRVPTITSASISIPAPDFRIAKLKVP